MNEWMNGIDVEIIYHKKYKLQSIHVIMSTLLFDKYDKYKWRKHCANYLIPHKEQFSSSYIRCRNKSHEPNGISQKSIREVIYPIIPYYCIHSQENIIHEFETIYSTYTGCLNKQLLRCFGVVVSSKNSQNLMLYDVL